MATFLRTLTLLGLGLVLLFLGLRGLVLIQQEDARAETEARVYLQRVAQALDAWHDEHAGTYPESLAPLAVEGLAIGLGPANFYGGLLRAPLLEMPAAWRALRSGQPLDPWGRPWHYEVRPDRRGARVATSGSRRQPAAQDEGEFAFELNAFEGAIAMVHLGHEPFWP